METRMRRIAIALLVAVMTVSCGRFNEDSRIGASGPPAEDLGLTAACGGARFPTLPPDPSVFPPFDGWDTVDLSGIGMERGFFDQFDWFVAEETAATLQLFGQPRSGERRGEDLYASAGFTFEDGTWSPEGWGNCRIELSADGWGNARFVLDPSSSVDPNASTVPVLATEMNCASGEPPMGREVRAVVLEETPETISIVVLVEPVEGGADCQGNPPFPYDVEVGSPLGHRHVLDASVYPPVYVGVPSSASPGPGGPSPGTTPPGTSTGPTHPTPDPGVPLGASEHRLPILIAVLHSIVDDEGVPLYINSQLCLGDETAKNCPDRLSEDEQAAIAATLPDREVHFTEGTDVGGDRVFSGEAQVAWLGPPMVADVGIQVVGSEVCGGLCGHGSVWLVEQKNGEWEVTGTAPGYGTWIA
jgi:hypothetical protein